MHPARTMISELPLPEPMVPYAGSFEQGMDFTPCLIDPLIWCTTHFQSRPKAERFLKVLERVRGLDWVTRHEIVNDLAKKREHSLNRALEFNALIRMLGQGELIYGMGGSRVHWAIGPPHNMGGYDSQHTPIPLPPSRIPGQQRLTRYFGKPKVKKSSGFKVFKNGGLQLPLKFYIHKKP